jgi:hypothetical protein
MRTDPVELIAEVLQDLYMGHQDWQRTLPQVANKFADRLAEVEPAFDREDFFLAAGVEQKG